MKTWQVRDAQGNLHTWHKAETPREIDAVRDMYDDYFRFCE